MAHYKKDGSLDMRYKSSKQAVASGSGSSSGYQPATSLGDHHLKKDGTLDMRYNSSQQAASSEFGKYPANQAFSDRPASLGDIHLKNDGSFDMRYSSSKEAVAAGLSDVHLKNDGSLDMRYTSSKHAASLGFGNSLTDSSSSHSLHSVQPATSSADHHLKKDGTLDMRYSSSKQAVSSGFGKYPSVTTYSDRPASLGDIHLKNDGSFDMRYSSSKEAVAAGLSNVHLKKDSSLDMRYTSSKHAAALGFGNSRPIQPANTLGDHHLKKDGTLDMRYNSSKQAASSGDASVLSDPSLITPCSYSGHPVDLSDSHLNNDSVDSGIGLSSNALDNSSGLHFKKDGALDMRYTSSKKLTEISSVDFGIGLSSKAVDNSSGLHFKKDGTLDMRYTSSKKLTENLAGISSGDSGIGLSWNSDGSGMHLKKDETLNIRYASSKTAADESSDPAIAYKIMNMTTPIYLHSIPAHVPVKKNGTPDMRTKAAKTWVAEQAAVNQEDIVPTWVPRTKDGSIDLNKPTGRVFLENKVHVNESMKCREKYWNDKWKNDNVFNRLVRRQRDEDVRLPQTPKFVFCKTPFGQEITREYDYMDFEIEKWRDIQYSSRQFQPSGMHIPKNITQLEYASIIFETGETRILGRGCFGVVVRAVWEGKPVAVKKLHLNQVTQKDRESFVNELPILNQLGMHENLVLFHGYCLNPLCIVMEMVELGNLSTLLHYCDKPDIEAKMTDGRIKKTIIFDIVNGMRQLHVVGIIHGDIKPQNILITKYYRAKITDFGRDTLRCKTSSTIDSRRLIDDDDDDEPHLGGGTSGYMAPELLDSTTPSDYPSDVYSFGILLNEIVSEEEPYTDQCQNFNEGGPFAATIYAKKGHRPTINVKQTPVRVQILIKRCWSNQPSRRPTFEEILTEIVDDKFIISNSFSLASITLVNSSERRRFSRPVAATTSVCRTSLMGEFEHLVGDNNITNDYDGIQKTRHIRSTSIAAEARAVSEEAQVPSALFGPSRAEVTTREQMSVKQLQVIKNGLPNQPFQRNRHIFDEIREDIDNAELISRESASRTLIASGNSKTNWGSFRKVPSVVPTPTPVCRTSSVGELVRPMGNRNIINSQDTGLHERGRQRASVAEEVGRIYGEPEVHPAPSVASDLSQIVELLFKIFTIVLNHLPVSVIFYISIFVIIILYVWSLK